jgi:hypothetical protein
LGIGPPTSCFVSLKNSSRLPSGCIGRDPGLTFLIRVAKSFVSIVIGDAHIYEDHVEAVKIQLDREHYPSPKLVINKYFSNIDDYKYEHFEVIDYKYYPTIKALIIA